MVVRVKSHTKEIRSRIMPDTVSMKGGIYTIRDGFFYTGGRTADDLVNKVRRAFPRARIIDSGEVWMPFKGGASVANQSHWYVKFTL